MSVAVTGVCRAVTGGEERSSSGRGEWSLRGGEGGGGYDGVRYDR